jgi:hypothetical protein
MKTITFYSCIVLSIISFGCRKIIYGEDEKFSIQKTDNLSGKLKLNGYYYSETVINGKTYRAIYILYQNGQLIVPASFPDKNLADIDTYLASIDFRSIIEKSKTVHGLYVIENNNIILENWTSGNGKANVRKGCGTITNDTSFVLSKIGTIEGNFVYNFRAYTPKPDSTNKFIK